MSLQKIKQFFSNVFDFIAVINRHNIFLFSSSLSYYTALALAPFLLILLKIGSLLGRSTQDELIFQAEFIFGEDVGKIMEMIFKNVNEGINLASISGILGVVTILLSVSVVYMQLRYSLDVINDDYNPDANKGFKAYVLERLFLMLVVIGTAILFLLSIFISNIVKFFAGDMIEQVLLGKILLMALNLLINVGLFFSVYYFIPSHRPRFNHAFKMALFSSVFFLVGKTLIGLYLENVAGHSVYGAAGTLLVFLVWAYYSAFTLFLSVELFLFVEHKKLKPHH